MKYIIYVIIALISFSCSVNSSSKDHVSVTVLPLKHLVDRLTDSSIQVNVMIPAGMSPENCDLSISTLKGLNSSKICFQLGNLPFESTMLRQALEKLDIKNVCLEKVCTEKSTGDPHLWLVPENLESMARYMASVLIETFPEQKERIERNCRKLTADFQRLSEKCRTTISRKENRTFIIYHPSLTQFAETYRLKQISIENGGKNASPTHIAHIIETAKKDHIRLLLVQKENDKTIVENISEECDCQIIRFNPLEENISEELERLITTIDLYL